MDKPNKKTNNRRRGTGTEKNFDSRPKKPDKTSNKSCHGSCIAVTSYLKTAYLFTLS